jgi:glycine/D-amino acid oxidase-like deaminating enzyme
MRLDRDLSCDIVIVGAGITGAIVAERLTRMNLNVCVVDRQKPSMGSTAASTAMLQWELDTSLTDLTDLYGFERAASIFHRSLAAANGLQAQIRRLGISCQFRPRSSLYLAANEISASDLLAEHRIRERAGLPGVYLHHRTLMSEFGIAREAAILSPGSSEADPVMLNRGFLDRAVERGARIFEGTVSQFHETGKEAIAEMENGKIVAGKHLVLATGYVMPDFVPSDLHEVASTWAIATGPQPDRLWRDGV